MCGRYTITSTARELVLRFRAELLDAAIEAFARPRFNAAPTQMLPVVMMDDGRRIDAMRWGLVPSWAKDLSIGARSINARIETAAQKPSFRDAVKRRRCLVPADSWYEWQKKPGGKIPLRIVPETGGLFAFAGLWDPWRAPEGKTTRSFTILTAPAHDAIKHVHERMPVILDPSLEEGWLDPAAHADELLKALPSHAPTAFCVHPVSTRINSPRNDEAALIEPVTPPDSLFDLR